nr:zinc finger, CCHC-type [Tanacetum cinerariifolium]
MRRLEAMGTYTDDEINRLARGDMFSQFESGGASGSGGCWDEEEGADHQDDKDEDGDGDTYDKSSGKVIPSAKSPGKTRICRWGKHLITVDHLLNKMGVQGGMVSRTVDENGVCPTRFKITSVKVVRSTIEGDEENAYSKKQANKGILSWFLEASPSKHPGGWATLEYHTENNVKSVIQELKTSLWMGMSYDRLGFREPEPHTAKFVKLDKFEGSDLKHWQKKMHFLLTTLKVVYVLSTLMPEFVKDETLFDETRRRCNEKNGFTQVKKKRSSRNNESTKNFRPVSMKPKTKFRPKENQSTAEPMTALSIGKKNVSKLGNSIKTASKKNVSTSGNRTVSLSNSFDALNDDNTVTMKEESVSKASTSGMYVEGQNSTPVVDKINLIEKHLMEGKCVLVDVDGKPLEKVDALGDHDNDDEVEPVDNDMARFLASNPTGVGYGTKSLMEQ